MRAVFLNCSLKKSPEVSNTQALIDKACHLFEQEGVVCQSIRLVDHTIPFGMQARVSDDDAWPTIFANVMNADIVVIATPIWLGEKSSVASLAIERLYASSGDKNTQGQYIYYNKVGGVLATGNEDGGKEACRALIYALQHIGFTIPPQVDAYWVGEAGPGPSYIEAGQKNTFTQRNTQFMVYNLIHFARMLAEQKIPAVGNVELGRTS